MFEDRTEAGCKLGSRLLKYKESKPIVIAIPRGGVVVGYEVARMLEAPLDVVVPRKIRAPFNPELAIGAVAEDGGVILDENLVQRLNVSESYIELERRRQIEEIRRRVEKYRLGRPRIPVEGRVVILAEDESKGDRCGCACCPFWHRTRIRGSVRRVHLPAQPHPFLCDKPVLQELPPGR